MVVNKQNKNNNANFKIIKSYKHMAKWVKGTIEVVGEKMYINLTFYINHVS